MPAKLAGIDRAIASRQEAVCQIEADTQGVASQWSAAL